MQHQSISEVVDVFTSAREVNELLVLVQSVLILTELFFQEVFNGLNIVISGSFYRLDPFGILNREL
jgi:hypothetical protein